MSAFLRSQPHVLRQLKASVGLALVFETNSFTSCVSMPTLGCSGQKELVKSCGERWMRLWSRLCVAVFIELSVRIILVMMVRVKRKQEQIRSVNQMCNVQMGKQSLI